MNELVKPDVPSALVIEDDRDAAIIIAEALKAAGCEIEIIHDGQSALTRLDEVTPDLVALDLHLPHISGKDILRRMRADDRLASIPVMIITADSVLGEELTFDADLVLLKPVSFSQISALARRLLPSD